MSDHELPEDARDAPSSETKVPEDRFDDEPPPTEEELAAAEALREALEGRAPPDPDAELARALRLAVAPKPLDAVTHRRLLDRFAPRTSPLRSILVPFAGLAAAAAVALFVSNSQHRVPAVAPVALEAKPVTLQRSRPTSGLFDAQFPATGETSKRVDTIAVSRERDLRGNRFAKWGVR
jgi:hypothetical protein